MQKIVITQARARLSCYDSTWKLVSGRLNPMRRLLQLVAVLCPACAGAILVVMIAAGRLHPDWTPYFDHVQWCADRLCIFGIVPGVTSWDEAKGVLYTHHIDGLQLNDKVKYGWGLFDQTGFGVQAQADSSATQQLVMQVQFSVTRTASMPGLTAGAVIARFGAPCFVRYSAYIEWPGVTLYYPFGTAYVAPAIENGITLTAKSNFNFNVNTPVSLSSDVYADLNANSLTLNAQCRQFQALDLPNAYPWRGFRSTRLYPDLN